MSNWSKVEYIKNLSITVDGGQDSSTIYGNERNCAAVTVSFNGMNDKYDDPYVDLQEENIGSQTYLVDYDTGKKLAWEKLDSDASGLFYSFSQGKFCNSPDSAPTRSIVVKRASVTFYVYGKCTLDMKRMIAVKIKLPNGNEVSSTKHDEEPHKIELLIKFPKRYSASDLEPIKWDLVHESDGCLSISKQYVAFAKLKSEFETHWVDYKFEKYTDYRGDLAYISRTTRKTDEKAVESITSWCFFLCPLGKQTTSKIRLIEGEEFTTEKLIYNQEPGALCLARLVITSLRWFNRVENNTEEGFFRLYDKYGNLGEFTMIFKDPINPTIGSQNLDLLN